MKKILLFISILLFSFISHAQLAGNSLQLKADGNFVAIPDAANASLSNNMTIEAWVYYKCNNATGTFIFTKGWCGSNWSYFFSIYNKKLRFGKWHPSLGGCANNHALFESSDSLQVNTWTHVAVVVNGLTVTFYMNGEDVGSTQLSGINGVGFHTSNQPLRISNYVNVGGSNTGTMKGNIDDVRLWHSARSQAEIQNNMNSELTGNEAGLYAYWKLNESGTGAGIVVANSAMATGATTNGTTTGTLGNLQFVDNSTVQNTLPTCDPVLWLKADSAVTYNGINQVSQWNDVSGFNHHVTQAVAINQPIYQYNVINTKPGVYFDGVNGKYFLNNTVNNLVNSGAARTVFVAGRRDCNTHVSGVVGGTLFTFRRSGLINTLTFGANTFGSPIYIYSDNNGIGNNNAAIGGNAIDTALNNFVVTYKVPAAGSQIQCNLNSIQQVVNQGAGSINAETGTTGFTVGDREDQPDLDWSGWIFETIVFNRTLTAKEISSIENYLKLKYPQTPNVFNALYSTTQNYSDAIMDDGTWQHAYYSADVNKIITSVKNNCLDLGSRNDTVYTHPGALAVGSAYYMRRHYVMKTTLNPVGTKRVRLYYTTADFADLQTVTPGLVSHAQLCVTKYDGPNEDGNFNSAGGTLTFIPSAQITTGTAFGQRYLEFDVTGFSEFWIHTGNVPLPLDLLSFHVTKENQSALLNWTTANIQQVAAFDIEKSADAKSFYKIGSVNADEKNEYNFTDLKLNERNNFYRLKMLDMDGKFTYSKTVMIINTDKASIALYPNPVKNELNILSSENNFSYKILDIYGKEIKSGVSTQNNITLSCESWQHGLYMVIVQVKDELKTLKLIKE